MSDVARQDRPGRLARVCAVAIVAALALTFAGCDGSSEKPPSPLEATLKDGKVCGLFDPDLAVSAAGTKDIKVRGTGIAGPARRTTDTIDCTVVDQSRFTTAILVIVAETPDKSDHDATATMLEREYADGGPGTCSQPAAVTDLGPGYTCTLESGEVHVDVLRPKRMVRLVYEPGPDAKGDPLLTAVKLVKDVDANVDAYDRKHG